MSTPLTHIDEKTAQWILKQKIFFTASAPLSAEGHINCSPKGLDAFRILDSKTVAYQDMVGSGAETIAHIRENKRLVIMFCAFEGAPRIVRLHGHGEYILPQHTNYTEIESHFEAKPGVRSYIKLHITRVSDSCGYSVPKFEYQEDRDVLDKWVERKGENEIKRYIEDNNKLSIDGLPAID